MLKRVATVAWVLKYLAAACLLAVVAGCGPKKPQPTTTSTAPPSATEAETGKKAKKKKKQKPVPPPEELYRTAEVFMNAKKYRKAVSNYEQINTAQSPDLRTQVHLRMADAYFAMGGLLNLAEAQSRYQSFLNFFPLSDQAPYAQYRFALCLSKQVNKPERDQGPTARAMLEFGKVEALYPSSSWVTESRQRVEDLEDLLSRDAVLKARFYYRRKSYPAAISRLKAILAENPNFPSRDEVLFLLGMALRKNDRAEEGALYLQRLTTDFPDSSFAKKARKKA